jgi:Na+:H+ antiporter
MEHAIAHPIEHAIGIYIGLLLLACCVGVASKMIAHVPYTIALTLVGLAVSFFPQSPAIQDTGFSKDLIFFVLLPPLLFQGSLHLNLNRLLKHFWVIASFAVPGVLFSTFIMAGVFYWMSGIDDFMIALLFGAMLSPTDPVSVLAIFKEVLVPDDLKYLVEGESLFNDGTGIVIFTIILGMIGTTGTDVSSTSMILGAVGKFIMVAGGGLVMGSVLGVAAFYVLGKIDDHLLENAICLALAFGSFWLAEVVHVSGVISTVMAGLLIGNYGRKLSMSEKVIDTVDTFFESIDFLINSLLFILMGLELHEVWTHGFSKNMGYIGAGIAALLISRALTVYPLYKTLNLGGTIRPKSWKHVLFWGGLRGSIPIALLLGLQGNAAIKPYYDLLLVACFGTVFFSLVVQGLTMKPLLKKLNLER